MIRAWLRRPLWQRIFAAFVLGVVAGIMFGAQTVTWAKPIGDLYLNLMRMIVIPLVFVSVSAGLARMRGVDRALRLFTRTVLWFLATSVCAIVVGIAFATVFEPGVGLGKLVLDNVKPKEIPSVLSVLINIVPANPVKALVDGNLLQILFMASLLGAALYVVGDKAHGVNRLLGEAETLVFRITRWVFQLMPLGTFGLIAWVVGQYGFSSLVPLFKFVCVLYGACAFHIVVVYGGLLKLHGLRPHHFFRSVLPAQQMAFVTASSIATLPLSLRTAIKKLGVLENYASFAVPLGATVKMDGCGAIYPAIASIFIAQYFGVDMSTTQYFLIAFTALLGSFATAGVPGTSLVMLTLTLSSAGLPLEGIGYIIAVDRVVDMIRTVTNVTGQILVAVLVAKEEGVLDRRVYEGEAGAVLSGPAVSL